MVAKEVLFCETINSSEIARVPSGKEREGKGKGKKVDGQDDA